MAELKENAGTQFDPQIVEIWLEIMEKYGIPKPEPTYQEGSLYNANPNASTTKTEKRLSPGKGKPL